MRPIECCATPSRASRGGRGARERRCANHDGQLVSEQFAGAVEFPAGTRTAADAAAAIGCEIGQIVKSLVFRQGEEGPPVLVLCAGSNTVDTEPLGLVKAGAGFVREATGYSIGAVPPWGWATP